MLQAMYNIFIYIEQKLLKFPKKDGERANN